MRYFVAIVWFDLIFKARNMFKEAEIYREHGHWSQRTNLKTRFYLVTTLHFLISQKRILLPSWDFSED